MDAAERPQLGIKSSEIGLSMISRLSKARCSLQRVEIRKGHDNQLMHWPN
jgi:hypothetical protein